MVSWTTIKRPRTNNSSFSSKKVAWPITRYCAAQFQEGVQAANNGQAGELLEVEGEVQPEPLDMRFPSKGFSKQITYIVLFPIIFPLWLTLPDTRGDRGK